VLLFPFFPFTGVLPRHGFVGSFPACLGSGLLPEGVLYDDALVENLDMGRQVYTTTPFSRQAWNIEAALSQTAREIRLISW